MGWGRKRSSCHCAAAARRCFIRKLDQTALRILELLALPETLVFREISTLRKGAFTRESPSLSRPFLGFLFIL